MKQIFYLLIISSLLSSSVLNMDSFEADFNQIIIDEKGKKLSYSGYVVALKPQYALWSYKKPVIKNVYMTPNSVTVVEPDIEQAVIRKISSDLDFFKMIQKAKKITNNKYIATLNASQYTILLDNSLIQSISYMDEFENKVTIFFTHQTKNKEISKDVFTINIPFEYDIIRD